MDDKEPEPNQHPHSGTWAETISRLGENIVFLLVVLAFLAACCGLPTWVYYALRMSNKVH